MRLRGRLMPAKPKMKAHLGVAKKPGRYNKNVQAKMGVRKPMASGSIAPTPQAAPIGSGAGGAPAPSALPPIPTLDDSSYENFLNSSRLRQKNEELGFAQQEAATNAEFGFGAEYANDPYTRASILTRRANEREAGTLNSLAGAGQLYSGSFNNARAADVLTSGNELNDARREMADRLASIQQARLTSQSDAAQREAEAYQAMLDRASSEDPDAGLFSGEEEEITDPFTGKKRRVKKRRPGVGKPGAKKPLKPKPRGTLQPAYNPPKKKRK